MFYVFSMYVIWLLFHKYSQEQLYYTVRLSVSLFILHTCIHTGFLTFCMKVPTDKQKYIWMYSLRQMIVFVVNPNS